MTHMQPPTLVDLSLLYEASDVCTTLTNTCKMSHNWSPPNACICLIRILENIQLKYASKCGAWNDIIFCVNKHKSFECSFFWYFTLVHEPLWRIWKKSEIQWQEHRMTPPQSSSDSYFFFLSSTFFTSNTFAISYMYLKCVIRLTYCCEYEIILV